MGRIRMEKRLQPAETKFGRGSARQIGKAIVAIRSHQNQRSEYDHLTNNQKPMTIYRQGQQSN